MKFEYYVGPLQDAPVDTLVLFVHQFERITARELKALNGASGSALTSLVESGEFTGKEGQIAAVLKPVDYRASRVLLVGLGERKKVDHDTYRRAAGRVSQTPGLKSSTTAAFCLVGTDNALFYQAAVEGYLLGSYELREFRSKPDSNDISHLSEIALVVPNRNRLRVIRSAVERGRIVADGQLLVRRLAFTPANYMTPKGLAREARALARQHGLECRVLDEKAIAREKMGALLGVAQGSQEPPRFIILSYHGGRAGAKPVVLVGKGVTFDSGGLSLKQPAMMPEMKGDMAGAAAVLATIVTAARLKVKLNLVGLMPATENMPSGTATRPSDVLTTRKGLTVEITNTDAEGRLILADALDYADQFSPQAVIDIATLTGASLYILGYAGAPILGNNERLLQRIQAAAKSTAEKVWPLPIWDEHRERMKSPIADLQNSAGREAGTVAAAAFLENFIGDWPWAHIDIAYVDVEPKGKPYVPKGASGFGLRLLIDLLINWKKLG